MLGGERSNQFAASQARRAPPLWPRSSGISLATRNLLLGILSAASVGRHRPCRLQLFPGDSPPAAVAPPSGDFDGPNPPAVTGFWTIYDDVALEDSMNRAARQEPDGPNSMMSSSIVLRADGFTSRGSVLCTWPRTRARKRARTRACTHANALTGAT